MSALTVQVLCCTLLDGVFQHEPQSVSAVASALKSLSLKMVQSVNKCGAQSYTSYILMSLNSQINPLNPNDPYRGLPHH